MRRSTLGLFLFLALLVSGARGESPASRAIDRIDGVYKERFPNSTVQGEKFESEKILELVRHDGDTLYFRLHLEFFNGHICALHGIAVYEDGVFTYRQPTDSGPECVLSFRVDDEKITLADRGGECRSFACGARGGFQGITFPRSARRKIKYMSRLKGSSEYREAAASFVERSRQQGAAKGQ